jgi:hypothetical protein
MFDLAIQNALDELGKNHIQVASKLSSLGVVGFRMSSKQCPVALYLRSKGCYFNSLSQVSISFSDTILDDEDSVMETPLAIRDFILRFDQGFYPDLEIK